MLRPLLSALITATIATSCAHEPVASPPSASAVSKPTFVLVHGALFTGAGWLGIETRLTDLGYPVLAPDVPGRSGDGIDPRTIDISVATAKVCEVVRTLRGPVILVGHSQGGALITQALNDCGDEVQSLVYIAAVVPKSGEIAFAGLDPEKDTSFFQCATDDEKAGLFRLNRNGPLEASFFQDLRAIDPDAADRALAGMVSEPRAIGTTPLAYDQARFDRTPKYYLEATLDRVISIDTQRRFQAQVPFTKVFSVAASHLPFLSQPDAVIKALVEVAGKRGEAAATR